MRQFTILKSFFPLIQMSFFFKLGDVFDKSCLPLIYNNTSIFDHFILTVLFTSSIITSPWQKNKTPTFKHYSIEGIPSTKTSNDKMNDEMKQCQREKME